MKYILTLLFIPLFLSCSKDNKDVPDNPNNYKDLGITYHNIFKEEDDKNLIKLSDYELKRADKLNYDKDNASSPKYWIVIELNNENIVLLKYRDDIDEDVLGKRDFSGFLATYIKTYKLYEKDSEQNYDLSKSFYLTLKKPIGEKKRVHFLSTDREVMPKKWYHMIYE